MPPPAAPPSPRCAAPTLWNRDFTLFIVSLALATMAIQIQAAAVGYQLYEITRDPLSLGALGLAEALPFISLALVGGHVADLLDRRRVMMGAFAVLALGSGALLLLTSFRAGLPVPAIKWGIYGVIMLERRLPGLPGPGPHRPVGPARAAGALPARDRLAHGRFPARRRDRPCRRRPPVRLGGGPRRLPGGARAAAGGGGDHAGRAQRAPRPTARRRGRSSPACGRGCAS